MLQHAGDGDRLVDAVLALVPIAQPVLAQHRRDLLVDAGEILVPVVDAGLALRREVHLAVLHDRLQLSLCRCNGAGERKFSVPGFFAVAQVHHLLKDLGRDAHLERPADHLHRRHRLWLVLGFDEGSGLLAGSGDLIGHLLSSTRYETTSNLAVRVSGELIHSVMARTKSLCAMIRSSTRGSRTNSPFASRP